MYVSNVGQGGVYELDGGSIIHPTTASNALLNRDTWGSMEAI